MHSPSSPLLSTGWCGRTGLAPTYECGIDPVGQGWSQTQVRYYIFAFLFVIFDVESVFLFPFATVFERFPNPGLVLVETIVFIGILAVGLLYAWKKKVLEWV